MATQMMTPPQLPDWDKIRNNGDWQSVAPFLQQEKNALAAQGQNMDLAKMLFEQQQQRFPLELDKDRALTDMHRAQGRASNASAAKSERELRVAPTEVQEAAYNLLKMQAGMSDLRKKEVDNTMSILNPIISAAEVNGGVIPLQHLNSLPEELRAIVTQKGGIAKARLMLRAHALNTEKHLQEMAEIGAREAAANSRTAATIAGQKDIAGMKLQAATDARIAKDAAGLQKAVAQQNHQQAYNHLSNLAYAMEQKADVEEDPQQKVVLTEKATQLRKEADARMQAVIAAEVAKVVGGAGGSITAKIEAAGGNRPPHATGAIQPNPAVNTPSTTSQARALQNTYKTEAEAQAAGAKGAFKKGDIIIINGKPVKVE